MLAPTDKKEEIVFPQCPSDEFSALFSSFEKSAFRLELLQTYLVDEETEEFSAFLAGKLLKTASPDMQVWCEDIQKAVSASKIYQRVRRIVLPLSDYTRFELITGYKYSVVAGEDIRILESGFESLSKITSIALTDFWLFDDRVCILLDYDKDGRYVGARKVPSESLHHYIAIKKYALNCSLRIQESDIWRKLDCEF